MGITATLALLGGTVYFIQHPPAFLSGFTSTSGTDKPARGQRVMPAEQAPSQGQKTAMDNATILRLWNAKVSAEVILQMMRKSDANYDVSPSAIIALREAQVDEDVILAMINRSGNR